MQPGRDPVPRVKKDLSSWDKEGGIDGLSVWIVYDFLTAKHKSVQWLSKWIQDLEGHHIMTIVEDSGKGQVQKIAEDDEDAESSQSQADRSSASDQSHRGQKVKFDPVDIDEYLLSATTQNKKQK